MEADDALRMKILGSWIKHARMQQNKTQGQLAGEAGIARSTLSLFERGENTSMLVFIQLLRALNLLDLLQAFQVEEQADAVQKFKARKPGRTRARNIRQDRKKPEPESDWCSWQ